MKKYLLFGVSLMALGQMLSCYRDASSKVELTYSLESAPTDADPLEFDLFEHHVAFGSTLSPLVTNYSRGRHLGLIAESWSVTEDQKVWKFLVRSGFRFEDGTLITPEVVVNSLVRIALLQKERGSKSGVIEHLEGISNLKMGGRIRGIEVEGQNVVLRFDQSMPNLLDQLSFGMYAVVSPKDYDPKTLKWLAGAHPTASGPYRIASKGPATLDLELREDYPKSLLHPFPFKRIHLAWNLDRDQFLSADLFSINDLGARDGYDFYPSGTRAIYYVKAVSWDDQSRVVHSVEARRWLRKKFYESYRAAGYPPPEWFLPGYVGTGSQDNPIDKPAGIEGSSVRYGRFKAGSSKRLNALNQAFEDMARNSGLTAVPVDLDGAQVKADQLNSTKRNYSTDFMVTGTEIRVDSPDEDIRFMFMSKEGIRLPDTDGRILAELARPKVDVLRINQLIWEQAAVWPTLHPVIGYYAALAANVDLSSLNLAVAPIQFQWIGRK